MSTICTKTSSRLFMRRLDGRVAHFMPDSEQGSYPRPEVFLAFAQWEDLGRPTEITVTIEPGDTLN